MIFDPILDFFRGKAVTIPPMDGALKPNVALEEANLVSEVPMPDNLIVDEEAMLFSSGKRLFSVPAESEVRASELARFETPITALAVSPGGHMAIGLDDGQVLVWDGLGEKRLVKLPSQFSCPTAISFADENTLVIAQGSSRNKPSDWALDLMQKNASGAVWRVTLDDAGGNDTAACLASGLAFPYGLLLREGGEIIVSESWRHRLLRLGGAETGNGAAQPILSKLPGYPARLTPAGDGGAWLTLFAPRNRLIEFVLQEDAYRRDMLAEVPRDFWIAPALSSGTSFLEPLQCGGVKTMGVHKPWSPSRSYGLVVRLDGNLQPIASFHSRSNGRRHGVTSVVEFAGVLVVAAKGGNALLALPDVAYLGLDKAARAVAVAGKAGERQ
ncbi:MAG TPA: hypothetical protein VM639_17745 [Dongiaceae bacterium]|nr:hypothetical protein [Dongiaceae bacterium]